MATVELTVRIFASVRSERLEIIIDINMRADRIPMQLENTLVILIRTERENGSFNSVEFITKITKITSLCKDDESIFELTEHTDR